MKTAIIAALAILTFAVPATTNAVTLTIEDEHTDGYSRDLFEHWTDADDDGCDTREEVLIAESIVPVTFESGCKIVLGQWYSSLDGDTITNPSTMDVDHTVALAEAWRSGAWSWTDEEREAFANDPAVLHAVSSGVNRQKSDRDPASWLPRVGVCEYVTEWVEIKTEYGLAFDPDEAAAIEEALASC